MLRSINCNKAISRNYKLKDKLTDSILFQQLAPLELLLEQQLFGSVAAVEVELLVVDELVVEHAAVAGLIVVVAAELVAVVGLGDAIVADDVELIQDVAKLYFVLFPRRPQHFQSNQDQLL